MSEKSNKFVIAVYVENKYGVLTRVTSMFTRRGFNIDALTVGETESPEYSRITISMSGNASDEEKEQTRAWFMQMCREAFQAMQDEDSGIEALQASLA